MKPIFIALLTMIPFFAFSENKGINLVTEIYPPYVYNENGLIKGVATEVVQAVFKEARVKYSINIYPFARALDDASTVSNTAIFPLIKLPEREPLLIWGNKLFPINAYVYTLKSRKDLSIHGIDDLQKYTNGAILNAADHVYLKEVGIKSIQTVVNLEQNIKKIMLGRIDTIILPEVCFNYVLKTMKLDKKKFVKTLKVKGLSTHAYLAFNKKTDAHLIEKLNQAFKAIKNKGIYKKIIDKYYK